MTGKPCNVDGLPVEDIKSVVYLIKFGLTPDQVERLPLRVEALLLPIARITEEESVARDTRGSGQPR